MLLFTELILGTTVLGNFILLFLTLYRQERTRVRWIFALYLVSVIVWTALILSNLWMKSPAIERAIFSSAAFGLGAQYWFFYRFSRGDREPSALSYLGFLPPVYFTVASLNPGVMFHSIDITAAGYTILDSGPLSSWYSYYVFSYVVLPLVLLGRAYRDSRETRMRKQLRYLSIGFAVFLVVNVLTNSVLPVFFGIFTFNAIGPVFSLLFAGFVLHIIARHSFLDIKIAVQGSLIYLSLLGLCVTTYLILVGLVGFVLGQATDSTILLSAGITMLLGIWGTPIIDRIFRRWTNPIFMRGEYDFAEAVSTLNEIGNRRIELEQLIADSSSGLGELLKAERVRFWNKDALSEEFRGDDRSPDRPAGTKDTTGPLIVSDANPIDAEDLRALYAIAHKENDEAILPIFSLGELRGAFFIGQKHGGVPYSAKDIDLLKTFSSQFAVAYDKALLYAEVAAYSLDLERKVRERTQEVTELRETEHQMLLDLSHGLQTPLAILKNDIETLRKRFPDRGEYASLERAIEATTKFVRDLLRLASLDRSDAPERARVDLSDLASELVEDIGIIADSERMRVESMLERDCVVMGDRDALRDAIANLMSNALKYMREDGKRTINVSLHKSEGRALLAIEDSGIGISVQDLPHLFERFYRARGARSRDTGLGLAIVKRIVDLHGGSISVMSIAGEGSTFSISLPLADRTA
jgi:signal transduction histidine kinase